MGQQQQKPGPGERAWDLATDSTFGGLAGVVLDAAQTGSRWNLDAPWGNAAKAMEASGHGGGAAVGGGLLSAAGILGGTVQGLEGVQKICDGQVTDGAFDVVAGGGSVVSGISGMFGLAPQGTAMAAEVAGVSSTGLGTSVASAGALPVAGAAGAGAALGITLGTRANAFMEDHGWLGDNVDGSNRSYSDAACDLGWAARERAEEAGLPAWAAAGLGGAATVGASVGSVVPAALTGAVGLGEDALDFGGALARDAWSAAFD